MSLVNQEIRKLTHTVIVHLNAINRMSDHGLLHYRRKARSPRRSRHHYRVIQSHLGAQQARTARLSGNGSAVRRASFPRPRAPTTAWWRLIWPGRRAVAGHQQKRERLPCHWKGHHDVHLSVQDPVSIAGAWEMRSGILRHRQERYRQRAITHSPCEWRRSPAQTWEDRSRGS